MVHFTWTIDSQHIFNTLFFSVCVAWGTRPPDDKPVFFKDRIKLEAVILKRSVEVIGSRHETPFIDSVPNKVDEVVRLLLAECKANAGNDHWDKVCARLSSKAGVVVRLVHDLLDWAPLRPCHGNTHFAKALFDCYVVVGGREPSWRLAFKIQDWKSPRGRTDSARTDAEPGTPTADNERAASDSHHPVVENADIVSRPRTNAGGPSETGRPEQRPLSPTHAVPPVHNEAYLIQEFDRRERDRGPIFAGFIVNDLLPRMGFSSSDAKRILRAMEAHDIVRTEQRRNPNRPGRTTSFIILNRDHPNVVRVLQGAAGVERTFPIATMDGDPLSEVIIRERR